MHCIKVVILFCFAGLGFKARSQAVFPLYTGAVPNSKATTVEEIKSEKNGSASYRKVSVPTITAFIPQGNNNKKTAVIIVPGGGYAYVAYTLTGTDIAGYFEKEGVVAFVLKYRLPDDEYMQDKKSGPVQDLQQAIIWVKQHAKEYGIDTARVGVLGCSAGGHLAAMGSTQFKTNFVNNPQKINLRPAFSVLLYPVISFADSITHKGSRNNLIGNDPSPELAKKYSNEWQVTPETPPTFLVQAQDDKTVPVINSILYFQALTKNGVPAEMHIYPKGGHGFGIHNKTTPDFWLDRCKNWMISNGWLSETSSNNP